MFLARWLGLEWMEEIVDAVRYVVGNGERAVER